MTAAVGKFRRLRLEWGFRSNSLIRAQSTGAFQGLGGFGLFLSGRLWESGCLLGLFARFLLL